MSKFVLWL
jgi:hypothetical protein